jgi:hypothetical protein
MPVIEFHPEFELGPPFGAFTPTEVGFRIACGV